MLHFRNANLLAGEKSFLRSSIVSAAIVSADTLNWLRTQMQTEVLLKYGGGIDEE